MSQRNVLICLQLSEASGLIHIYSFTSTKGFNRPEEAQLKKSVQVNFVFPLMTTLNSTMKYYRLDNIRVISTKIKDKYRIVEYFAVFNVATEYKMIILDPKRVDTQLSV